MVGHSSVEVDVDKGFASDEEDLSLEYHFIFLDREVVSGEWVNLCSCELDLAVLSLTAEDRSNSLVGDWVLCEHRYVGRFAQTRT